MTMKADEAVDILRAYLVKNRLKFTSQRELVTQVFFDPQYDEDHPTVEELYMRVRSLDSNVGYATVYRTLKLLTACELAHPNRLGDGQTRYEPETPGEHHDHLVCAECGAIIEFEDDEIERRQHQVAENHGFVLTDHQMVLFGPYHTRRSSHFYISRNF